MTDVASLRMVICLYEVRDESLGRLSLKVKENSTKDIIHSLFINDY